MVPKLDTRIDAVMAFQTVTEHARTLERQLAEEKSFVATLEENRQRDSDHSNKLVGRISELEEIIRRLVHAKDEKDSHGVTARYRKMKEGTWESARAILPENVTTEARHE